MKYAQHMKKVICLETGTVWASGRDAAKEMGVSKSSISYSCRNAKAVSGMNFRFIDENGNIITTPSEPKFKRTKAKANEDQIVMEAPIVVIHEKSVVTAEQGEHINGNSKAVCCLDTGEVFPSLTDAAKAHGIDLSHLAKCCRGELPLAKGRRYFYVKLASENMESIVSYIRELHSKANAGGYDPEYIAWKAEKERATRKAELEQLISTAKETICELEVKTAHEYELLEAYIAELEKLNA